MSAHGAVHANRRALARPWLAAAAHAAPVIIATLGLFYYWFGVADRYTVFLYGHLGATPFDVVTSSRYWMAGLLAGGIVLVLYTLLNLLMGAAVRHAHRTYLPPAAWRVWICCAPVVAIGVLAITMGMNAPTLPLGLALACAATALAGLFLALLPGRWAATRPCSLLGLALDGLGLAPILALARALELPAKGILALGAAVGVVTASLVGGALWLLLLGWIRARLRASSAAASAVFAAGLALAYLLTTLMHYLFFAPAGYRYITTAGNLFPENSLLLLASWGAAGLLARGATALRRHAALRRRPAQEAGVAR